MPSYLVVEPCVYTNADGSVTQWRAAGAVVELPADVAAEVGAALQQLATSPVKVAAPRGKRRAAAETATAVEVDGVDQGSPSVTLPDDAASCIEVKAIGGGGDGYHGATDPR
jgi:hypothetical protein